MPAPQQSVAEYYDRNTRRFLLLGQGGRELAIHRAVWGPGVRQRDQALHYINEVILRVCREIQAGQVLDLGCGVGGTMIYLAQRLQARFRGMTISREQAVLGEGLIRDRGLDGSVEILLGDFTSAEAFRSIPAQDCVYAVESLLHSPDPGATLANAAGLLREGGRLVICDDMLATADDHAAPRDRQRARLEEFRQHWHAYGLLPREVLVGLCRGLGLHLLEDQDLTDQLELGRLRDRLARLALPLLRLTRQPRPWARNLLGGTALQALLKDRILEYHCLVFSKPGARAAPAQP